MLCVVIYLLYDLTLLLNLYIDVLGMEPYSIELPDHHVKHLINLMVILLKVSETLLFVRVELPFLLLFSNFVESPVLFLEYRPVILLFCRALVKTGFKQHPLLDLFLLVDQHPLKSLQVLFEHVDVLLLFLLYILGVVRLLLSQESFKHD